MKKVFYYFIMCLFVGIFTTSCQDEEPQLDSSKALLSTELVDLTGTWELTEMYIQNGTTKTLIDYTKIPTNETETNEYYAIFKTINYEDGICSITSENYIWNQTLSAPEKETRYFIYFYQIVDNKITWDEDQITNFFISEGKLHIITSLLYDSTNKYKVYSVYSLKK